MPSRLISTHLIAETLKYLYLIFDERNAFRDERFTFTTEGHLLDIALTYDRASHANTLSEWRCRPPVLRKDSAVANKDTWGWQRLNAHGINLADVLW